MRLSLAGHRVALLVLIAICSSPAMAATVVVYASTDLQVVKPLIADFEMLYPEVKVDYHELNSTELYARFLREAGTESRADVVWSSAMDLQMKLVNDGHAQPYKSAQTEALPPWAVWKNEAFGTTYEPVGFVYNRKLLGADSVPQSHAELQRLLKEHPDRFSGRVTTYDPHRSGLGYLLHSQDLEANPVLFWNLIAMLGAAGLDTEPTTAAMIDRITSGRAVLGYNVLSSYALSRAASDERIGIVLPRDYTLVMSRIAFISRYAPHPDSARIWLDYLLSVRGQAVLNRIGLLSVRSDVAGEGTSGALRRRLGNAFRPIVLGTGLLTYLDQMKRQIFLDRWDGALGLTVQDLPSRPVAARKTD
ncbi:MAG: ABC transporter substrate-binding protein [Burkholderiales bacterium]|nr:ABC transporter substrate-binding protein [Burkholderiales bacterium]